MLVGRGLGAGLGVGLWIGLGLGVRRGGLGVGGGMPLPLPLDWWGELWVLLLLVPRRVKRKTVAMGCCSKMMLLWR